LLLRGGGSASRGPSPSIFTMFPAASELTFFHLRSQ